MEGGTEVRERERGCAEEKRTRKMRTVHSHGRLEEGRRSSAVVGNHISIAEVTEVIEDNVAYTQSGADSLELLYGPDSSKIRGEDKKRKKNSLVGLLQNVPDMDITCQVLMIVLASQLICWTRQFIGHGVFEKRAPALLDNLAQAFLMAIFFEVLEILQSPIGYVPFSGFQKRVNKKGEVHSFSHLSGEPPPPSERCEKLCILDEVSDAKYIGFEKFVCVQEEKRREDRGSENAENGATAVTAPQS